MSEPTQDKDTDLLHADGMVLYRWYLDAKERTIGDSFAALRDEVKRQARVGYVRVEDVNAQVDKLLAENARLRAQLDTARRDGAREGLTRVVAERLSGEWTSIAGRGVIAFRDREYPAPSPEAPATREQPLRDRSCSKPCPACEDAGQCEESSPTATPAPAGEPLDIDIHAMQVTAGADDGTTEAP